MINSKKIVLELVAKESEDEIVEFKEAKNSYDFKKLGYYFSALSNEANLKEKDFAWLCFGVRDVDHSFVNSQYRLANTSLQSLKGEIARKTISGITFIDIFAFEIEPDKRVVLFQIPAAPSGFPVPFNGHYYARNHEELTSLSMSKIEKIRAQTPRKDWSMLICKGATISDLDPEAIQKARELYKKKNEHLAKFVNSWDDKKFLNKAKITIKGKITNTAILLLGRVESVHFISPAVSKISWILKSKDGIELDYEHFTSPLILSVSQLYAKIRNLRYRYMQEGSLFPEEVYTYDPSVIREALNNCIAHQDYKLAGKINVIENEDDSLIFTNLGSFLPISVENVIKADAPSTFYRNRFLSDAMVNLSMIDTIGSGIKKMFISQKKKFFPLPDYDLGENTVKVAIIGKVLDVNYARKLAQIPDLNLDTIILLDKVQKRKTLTAEEAKFLRNQGFIEGKRPNLYISSSVAVTTGQKADYMKLRGVDDDYVKKMIIDYLDTYDVGTRSDFNEMLLEKLPDALTFNQKKNKIKNILQVLKKSKIIKISNGLRGTLFFDTQFITRSC